ALLLTPNTFSQQAFLRAGVKTPIHLVPVPVADAYFDLPVWEPGQRTVLECPCYRFPQAEPPASGGVNPWVPEQRTGFGLRGRIRQVYKNYVKPRLPASVENNFCRARRLMAMVRSGAKAPPSTDPVAP